MSRDADGGELGELSAFERGHVGLGRPYSTARPDGIGRKAVTTSSDAVSESPTTGATALIKKDKESVSRAYLTLLAFCVILESTIIGMMTPIWFPLNLILFLVIAAATTWAFLKSDWARTKLVELTKLFEDKAA
jgi:hypothetical protein